MCYVYLHTQLIIVHVSSDYRLNPQLRKACKADIAKFCHVTMQESKPTELEGEVIKCLKLKFIDKVSSRLIDVMFTSVMVVTYGLYSPYLCRMT